MNVQKYDFLSLCPVHLSFHPSRAPKPSFHLNFSVFRVTCSWYSLVSVALVSLSRLFHFPRSLVLLFVLLPPSACFICVCLSLSFLLFAFVSPILRPGFVCISLVRSISRHLNIYSSLFFLLFPFHHLFSFLYSLRPLNNIMAPVFSSPNPVFPLLFFFYPLIVRL